MGFCDFDEDSIIDVCDTDIDGDGIPNMLWLLLWEHPSCLFTATVVDTDRLDEQIGLIEMWEELDNCPFVVNSNQADADGDSLGPLW